MKRTNLSIISTVEKGYLYKWLRREGMNKIYKYRNAPEIILTNYKDHLQSYGKQFARPGTDPQRLKEIVYYVDCMINIFPHYKKLLKMHNLKSYEVGLMLGYKSSTTWHNSYKKFTYMRFLVTMITRHKELLETI